MKRYRSVVGIPTDGSLDELSARLAGALAVRPIRRISHFRAGIYDTFPVGQGQVVLQRNYDEEEGTPLFGDGTYSFVLDLRDLQEAAVQSIREAAGRVVGADCPVLHRSVIDHPLLDL